MDVINLYKDPKRFAELPAPVKMAVATLLAGWLVHFFLLFRLFQGQIPQSMLLQQAALAVISFFVLLKLKNWARILCITGNAIVLLFYLALLAGLLGGGGGAVLTGIALVSVGLFGYSTFLLWNPETADFFKRQSVKPPQSAN